jgi:hypothetical protein
VRSITSLSIALSVFTLFGVATLSQAATPVTKARHHHVHIVAMPDPQPHRVCDWIGPGARAVYRCTVVDPEPLHMTQNAAAPRHSCDWIGPGARAVYRCK